MTAVSHVVFFRVTENNTATGHKTSRYRSSSFLFSSPSVDSTITIVLSNQNLSSPFNDSWAQKKKHRDAFAEFRIQTQNEV